MHIERQMSIEFPLSLAFEITTIRDQAKWLDSGRKQEEKVSCMPISGGRDGVTVVFANAESGLHLFSALTEYLQGVRIVGMISSLTSRQIGDRDPLRTIAELQTNALLEAVPDGDLIIVGHSAGGLIAMEIAQHLGERDRYVKAVILLDTAIPSTLHRITRRDLIELTRDLLRAMRMRGWRGGKNILRGLIKQRLQDFQQKYKKVFRGRIKIYFKHLFRHQNHVGDDLVTAKDDRLLSVLELVEEHHVRKYESRVVLVRARDTSMLGFEDTTLGWAGFVPNSLEVRFVPGDHMTMLDQENVGHVANVLQEFLSFDSGSD